MSNRELIADLKVLSGIYRDVPAGEMIATAVGIIEAMEWQPIEDMPEDFKDGRDVLLHGDLVPPCPVTGKTTVLASWSTHSSGGWIWYGAVASNFTHWMPLPTPPQTGE